MSANVCCFSSFQLFFENKRVSFGKLIRITVTIDSIHLFHFFGKKGTKSIIKNRLGVLVTSFESRQGFFFGKLFFIVVTEICGMLTDATLRNLNIIKGQDNIFVIVHKAKKLEGREFFV